MVPPGLAMVSVSPRAWAAAEQATMPRFYFDLQGHRDSAAKGETPWTPAVGVVLRARRGARSHRGRGLASRSSRATRRAARRPAPVSRALGLPLFADPAHASNTVTSALVPEGVGVVDAEQGAARLAGSCWRAARAADRQDLPRRPPGRRERRRHRIGDETCSRRCSATPGRPVERGLGRRCRTSLPDRGSASGGAGRRRRAA